MITTAIPDYVVLERKVSPAGHSRNNPIIKTKDPFWNQRAKVMTGGNTHSALTLTISGRRAHFKDITSQVTASVSHPIPTYSALVNILRHLAPHLKSKFIPLGVEILNPVKYDNITFNLTGPERKSTHIKSGSNSMISQGILLDPRYRVFFAVTNKDPNLAGATIQKIGRAIKTSNHRPLFLGCREYPADIEFSNPEEPIENVNEVIPTMLKEIDYTKSKTIQVYQDVVIDRGRAHYPKTSHEVTFFTTK